LSIDNKEKGRRVPARRWRAHPATRPPQLSLALHEPSDSLGSRDEQLLVEDAVPLDTQREVSKSRSLES